MPRTNRAAHLNEPVLRFIRRDFARVQADETVAEAVRNLRQAEIGGRIVYFYVVDKEGRLQGVITTRRLLLSPPETPIRQIMITSVITLPESATLMDACEFFLLHRLLAIPVVDNQKRLLGIVDVEICSDEMIDLERDAVSEDIYQLIGVRLDEVRRASLASMFRNRFPWLLCNVAGGLACAWIAQQYQGILDNVIILALFIPVVLALGESVSIQSLTLTLQSLHGPGTSWAAQSKRLGREALLGLMLGIACGALVGGAALVWQRHPKVALCLLLSMLASIMTAAILGRLVPTVLRNIRCDPRVASGPIALALTDGASLVAYLGTAAWLLS